MGRGFSSEWETPIDSQSSGWKILSSGNCFPSLFPSQMMKFAWDNYKQYALGKNELRPLTKNGHIGNMFGELGSFYCNFTCFELLNVPCPGQLLSLQCRECAVTALIPSLLLLV